MHSYSRPSVFPNFLTFHQCPRSTYRTTAVTGVKNMTTLSDKWLNFSVCNVNDIPDEGVKSFDVEGGKILLAKTGGEVFATGTKCTHYGLPLEKGNLCNGRIRCSFHGACFNLRSGDIEDFPGLDSIPRFDVTVSDEGEVTVKVNPAQLKTHKRAKQLCKRDTSDTRTFIVVGGGAAGAKCVETLRQEGYEGRLIFVSAEDCLPYDRPKLSKALHSTADELSIRTSAFYDEADIELQLGCKVASLNSGSKYITLSNGDRLNYDKLFFATGGMPRTLSIPGSNLEGVFLLRKPEDGNAIVEAAKGKPVVIIGTSFIGMEVAAYLSQEGRCDSVTIVGSSAVPFERSLGWKVGERIQAMFEEKGVTFINNASVTKLEGKSCVEKVIINNDREVEAGIVIAGIGVLPSTGYLKGSGIDMDSRGYVIVDEQMKTNVEGIYCGGDIASFPLFMAEGTPVSIGHWQMAHQHGHIAALNMVGKTTSIKSIPFFWTMLYGKSIRYSGYGPFDDVIIEGDLTQKELSFIAYYCQGDKVVAVASLGRAPAAAKYADYLRQGNFLTKQEVLQDGEVVLKLKY